MKTLTERLNLIAGHKESDRADAVNFDSRRDINYYDTLCLYCNENDINLTDINDEDFNACVDKLKYFAINATHESDGYTHVRHGAIVSHDGTIYNKTAGKINGLYTNTSVNINRLPD